MRTVQNLCRPGKRAPSPLVVHKGEVLPRRPPKAEHGCTQRMNGDVPVGTQDAAGKNLFHVFESHTPFMH